MYSAWTKPTKSLKASDANIKPNNFKLYKRWKKKKKKMDQVSLRLDGVKLSLINQNAEDPPLDCDSDNNQRLDQARSPE